MKENKKTKKGGIAKKLVATGLTALTALGIATATGACVDKAQEPIEDKNTNTNTTLVEDNKQEKLDFTVLDEKIRNEIGLEADEKIGYAIGESFMSGNNKMLYVLCNSGLFYTLGENLEGLDLSSNANINAIAEKDLFFYSIVGKLPDGYNSGGYEGIDVDQVIMGENDLTSAYKIENPIITWAVNIPLVEDAGNNELLNHDIVSLRKTEDGSIVFTSSSMLAEKDEEHSYSDIEYTIDAGDYVIGMSTTSLGKDLHGEFFDEVLGKDADELIFEEINRASRESAQAFLER